MLFGNRLVLKGENRGMRVFRHCFIEHGTDVRIEEGKPEHNRSVSGLVRNERSRSNSAE